MKIKMEKIIVDKAQVLKFLGYGKQEPPLIIAKKVDEEIERAYDLFVPAAFIQPLAINSIKNDEVVFGGRYRIKSEYVSDELSRASSLYLLLYTLGAEIQAKIDEYGGRAEMIRGMILDKIGVVALDNIAEQLQRLIAKQIAPLKISAKMYPSQKDFAITNQHIFIAAFQNENDIITISKHGQFQPIKTVAALFAIGKTEDLTHMCDQCEQKCHG